MRLPVEETGSGVIVQLDPDDQRKYVLTNLHVVRNASLDDIRVRLSDGRELHPTQMWSDPDTDLAVLSISAARLVPARLGDSERVEIGDFVLAFGSPFGLSHSVTFGIVGAKGRRDLALSSQQQLRIQEFLQTDAAINPGNSGGPLVNLRGEVIGINTAIASNSGGSEGIGFSIPINMALVVSRQLAQRGVVEYAYLGVSWDSSFTPAVAAQMGLPRPGGARVKQITPRSPAESAQLRAGDVLLRFDGTDIENGTHLANLVGLTPVGKKIPVVIFRDGRSMTVDVTLSERRRFDAR
jgi:serine protease Do